MGVITKSIIACPRCGYSKTEKMPVNSCQYFYQCDNCQTVLKPEAGDCCVYCSFGSVKCPTRQRKENILS